MKNTTIAACASTLLAATIALAPPVAAGGGFPAPTVTPASGPVGTTFTVSGTGCDPDGPQTVTVVADGTDEGVGGSPDATWSVEFTVSETTEPGPIDIEATCTGSASPAPDVPPVPVSQDYPVVQFTVTETPTTEPDDPTPTSEPESAPTTVATDSGALPDAEAASPVVETPTFTG